jgi:hypothetical protein
MGVDGGCRNRAVSEQDLHQSEIDVAFEKPGRIAVPKTVQGAAGKAGLTCGDAKGPTECTATDRPGTGLIGKKPTPVPVCRPELAQVLQNRPGEWNDPLLVALADDPQLTVDAVDGTDLKRRRLSRPQAACVDDSAAGSIDRVPQPRQERADLGIAEGVGKALLLGLADLFFANSAQSRLSVLRYRNWMP